MTTKTQLTKAQLQLIQDAMKAAAKRGFNPMNSQPVYDRNYKRMANLVQYRNAHIQWYG